MMVRIGMCPDPYFETEWSRNANPHLVWLANAIKESGGEIVPLTRKQAQQPHLWKEMNIDVVHLHWPGAVFDFYVSRRKVQKILPQEIVIKWAEFQMSQWKKSVQIEKVPIVWQVHDILSHHGVGYNRPADVILHRAIFHCCDGLILHGNGCYQPVHEFYKEDKPFAVAPLGSYRPLYGPAITKDEARKRLDLNNKGKVFAYLGTARLKRNAAASVKAFTEVASENDILLIAGNDQDLYLPKQLDSRIRLYHGVVPKSQFLEILCATDFVINDGPNYLTSAIIRTVVGYHRPVICYPYGSALDFADQCSIWIDDNKGGLHTAIQEASRMDEKTWQKLSEAASKNDLAFTWEQNGAACMALYEKVITGKKK